MIYVCTGCRREVESNQPTKQTNKQTKEMCPDWSTIHKRLECVFIVFGREYILNIYHNRLFLCILWNIYKIWDLFLQNWKICQSLWFMIWLFHFWVISFDKHLHKYNKLCWLTFITKTTNTKAVNPGNLRWSLQIFPNSGWEGSLGARAGVGVEGELGVDGELGVEGELGVKGELGVVGEEVVKGEEVVEG